ncbi:phosphatase PAP2 family protein [Bacillus massilinigeriensis]|uniref:phosphatase PAP2 family protein n=1 Tax=Bacillus mediterraneensis TaxID=1805474 RepID=UPI0008F832B2|nr:phosphatase PAP2 family protein [Bacillus mediterraneensis]
MRDKLQRAPFLLFLLVMPALGGIYKLLNNNPRDAVVLSTKVDAGIPFIPAFILPYIFWYVFIVGYLVYFCFKDTKVYIQTLTVIFIGELVCFLIYFFFQTTVPRPALHGDGLLIDLVGMIYQHDQPFNCFPSIHVLTTFAIMLGSIHIKNKSVFHSLFIPSTGSLIIISTLFVKQHYILDMFGSMFLTTFVYGLVFELITIYLPHKSKTIIVKK